MRELELTAKGPAPTTRNEAWQAFIAANLQRVVVADAGRGEKKIRQQAKNWGLHLFAVEYLVNRQACRVIDIRTGLTCVVPVPTTPHRCGVGDVEVLLEKYAVIPAYETLAALQKEAVAWYGYRAGSLVHYICSRAGLQRSELF